MQRSVGFSMGFIREGFWPEEHAVLPTYLQSFFSFLVCFSVIEMNKAVTSCSE